MEMVKFRVIAITLLAAILAVSMTPASGQITTACTNSLISSFTPCLNFITGSTNGGSSPTADCCSSLRSLLSSGTGCVCLILTGNVPVSLPINRTLAISLPRACKLSSVPLQCNGAATPIAAPGPLTYGQSLPPLTSSGSDSESPSISPSPTTSDVASPPMFAEGPSNQGRKPVVIPSSAVKIPHIYSPCLMLLVVIGTLLLNKF